MSPRDVGKDVKQKHSHFKVREVGKNLILYDLSEKAAAALSKIGDDDPAVMLRWTWANVIDAVAFLNNAFANGAAMPAWLGAFPTNEDEFTQSVAEYVGRVGGGTVGETLIAPNNLAQAFAVREQLVALAFDQTLMTLPAAVLPLARAYTIADRKLQTSAEPCPVQAPVPPGVNVIA